MLTADSFATHGAVVLIDWLIVRYETNEEYVFCAEKLAGDKAAVRPKQNWSTTNETSTGT